jgi:methionine synthase II (cobalamin-independent)
MDPFQPKFLATGIGSVPFIEAERGVDFALGHLPDAPFWPQLPQRDLTEHLEIQFTEGMPRVVIDRDKGRVHFDTAGDYSEDFAAFYETYLAAMDPESGSGDCSAAAISPAYAAGIDALENRLSRSGGRRPFVKVQVTGPCSLALTVTDENKRAIYYNDEFRDVIVKALAMKCRWQIQKFRRHAGRVICFIDEPILAAFGSSTYVAVRREDMVALLAEVVDAAHADGALAGIHCCGNTEWSIPIDAGADIVNFDAFGFGDTIVMYAGAVKAHLERGGCLAWGIVPTSTAIREQTVDSLAANFEAAMDRLAAKGIDKRLIAEQALLTPACGVGTLSPADADKVLTLTAALSRAMRSKYGFGG